VLDDVRSYWHAFRARQPLNFPASFEKLRTDGRISPQRSDRKAGRAGKTGQRHEKDELLPDRRPAVLNTLRLNVRGAESVVDGANTSGESRQLAKDFSKYDSTMGAGLLDHPGCGQCGGYVGRATYHGAFPDNSRDLLCAVNAILECQHGRLRTKHRRDLRQRRRIVVGLHGEEDDVYWSYPRRVFFHRRPDREVAEHRAANGEAVLAHGREMCASRNKGHVMTGTSEPGSVITADSAGSKNRETHPYRSRFPNSAARP